jgi:hypothetical protein
MTFEQAQAEFAVRHYLWAAEESRLEVERGFPWLSQMHTRICRLYLKRMAELSIDDRHALAALLVKRFHVKALKLLGENLSDEEITEIKHFADGGALEIDPVENDFYQRQSKGDPTVKLNRGRLKNIAQERLSSIFVNEDHWGGGGTWRYSTPIGDMAVQTYVDTGGAQHQLCYFHRIIFSGSQALVEQTSLLSWLGLSSQTHWRQLDDSTTEEAVRILADACSHFICIAPKLLKGIVP